MEMDNVKICRNQNEHLQLSSGYRHSFCRFHPKSRSEVTVKETVSLSKQNQ